MTTIVVTGKDAAGLDMADQYVDQGVWVDPIMPAGFMDRLLKDRSKVEVMIWWQQPFVVSAQADQDGSMVYELFSLDGSGPSGVGGYGRFDVYEEAVEAGVALLAARS